MSTPKALSRLEDECPIQVMEDQDAHVKDTLTFNRIEDGRLVPCHWDDLTEDEKCACLANLFRLY